MNLQSAPCSTLSIEHLHLKNHLLSESRRYTLPVKKRRCWVVCVIRCQTGTIKPPPIRRVVCVVWGGVVFSNNVGVFFFCFFALFVHIDMYAAAAAAAV